MNVHEPNDRKLRQQNDSWYGKDEKASSAFIQNEGGALIEGSGQTNGSSQDGRSLDGESLQKRKPVRFYRTRWEAWLMISAGWVFSLCAVIIRGGAVECFAVAVLGAVIIFSGVFPFIAAYGLTAARSVSRQETVAGGGLSIQLTLRRAVVLPFVWFALRDETAEVGSAAYRSVSYRTLLLPALSRKVHVLYSLSKLQRGRYPYEHVNVTVGDWLGLTAIHKKIEAPSEFIVLPSLPGENGEPAELGGLPAHGGAASLEATIFSNPRSEAGREEIEAAVHAAGLGPATRPYQEGDSLRHLDWRTAAKGRGLHTKIHMHEQPGQVWIALDTSPSSYDQDDRLFDACIGWVALAAKHAARLGAAAVVMTGQGMLAERSSSRTERETQLGPADLLRALALLSWSEAGSLASAFTQLKQSPERGGAMLIFTADWRSGRSWGELAGFAAEQGCRMELFVVSRLSQPTFAMREQQRWLESGGIKVTWLHAPEMMYEPPHAESGGGAYEYA